MVGGLKVPSRDNHLLSPQLLRFLQQQGRSDQVLGTFLATQSNSLNIQQFVDSMHPYLLPNFMNLFTWSIPFVIDKCSDVLYHLIKPDQKIEGEEIPLDILANKDVLEKLMDVTKKQVNQNIGLVSLDGDCPDEKLLETGKFHEGKKANFEGRKKIDSRN